ncbi:MAG TPA: hypothetical protein VL282_09950, partial [Tepidisphaeraceae bacterium]|nr:hypothetical protein [Tepidisphaeraceae bacterium]
ELRRVAGEAMLDQQKQQRRSAQVLAAAQGHIDRGELSRGAQLLAGVNQESRAVLLMSDLEAKRERMERAPQLREKLQQNLEAGRLDLAELIVNELRGVDGQSVESQQLLRAMEQCRQAWDMIRTGELREAEEITRRLANVFPKAKWLNETTRQLSEVARMMEEVRSGPLGMMSRGQTTVKLQDTIAPEKKGDSHLFPAAAEKKGEKKGGCHLLSGALPSRFMLRVDGAGSFLVLRAPSITIGPVSSSRLPDIGLIAEPGLPVATIDRVEDDYFLRGAVAGNKLLSSGDGIELSPRCRMHFVLPHVASTTAVIDLTGARCPRAEVRRIILLDRDLVIGPGSNTHVRVDHMSQPVVLRLKGDRLTSDSGEIPVGQTVQSGNVSFVISNA